MYASIYDQTAYLVFNLNRNTMKEENYILDILNDSRKEYFPNGKIRSEENWVAGEMNGENKYYDNTGKLKENRIYFYNTLVEIK